MSTTEVLVFLLSHTRLSDGTCFEVDPANEYEITMVRNSRAFFCMFALNFFDFQAKGRRRELGKIWYDSSAKTSKLYPTAGGSNAYCIAACTPIKCVSLHMANAASRPYMSIRNSYHWTRARDPVPQVKQIVTHVAPLISVFVLLATVTLTFMKINILC